MATIATDGKGNYVTLDSNGNWVPTEAPTKGQGELGYAAAPPEEKPPPSSQAPVPAVDEYGRPLPGAPLTDSTGAIGRIKQAASEGYEAATPDVTPGRLMSPVNYTLAQIPGVIGGAFRGGQQAVQEALTPISPQLGRDVAALPEAFPFGFGNLRPPTRPPVPGAELRVPGTTQSVPFMHGPQPPQNTLLQPRFVPEYYGEGTPQNPLASGPNTANMTTAERITNAVRGADQPPGSQPPAPYQPPAFVPPNTSPYPPSAPRAVEAGPRPTGGDAVAYGTPLPGRPAQPPDFAASAPNFVPPTVQEAAMPLAGQPPPPTGAPGPASVGAAASRQGTPGHMITLSPAEEQAYRSTAEGQKLLETQQPGIADTRQLVPGVQANSAEIEQTAQAARELKSLKLQSPALSDDAFAATDANNTARQGFYNGLAGSKVTLQNAIDARAAQADRDLTATWANKTDTTPQPVLNTANDILQSEDGRRPAVRNAVNAVTKELYDDNGNLITDPQLLYGVRKHIDDMLSKEGAATDPLAVRAKANLMQLKNSLDGVISAGAPGFQNYLDNFSTASRPIDTMRVLQDHEVGLYGSQNRMEYARFQRFMKDVVDARSSTGPNPYKSIPDDTMQQLWNIRDDLRRSSAAVELAKTAGSDTAQNLMDLARHGLARGVGATVGGTVGSVLGPIGTGVGASVGAQAGERFVAGRAEQRAYQRGQQLLYPQNQLGP